MIPGSKHLVMTKDIRNDVNFFFLETSSTSSELSFMNFRWSAA